MDVNKNVLWKNRRKSRDLQRAKALRQKFRRSRTFSVVGELQQHLQSIFFLLRSQDTITLAVRLESIYDKHIRYMVLVSTLGVDDSEETIILGVDLQNTHCSVGLVLPVWGDTNISMDGDGGFGVHTNSRAYIFKPVSIQAMWSAIQCLNKTCQIARNMNYIPAALNLTWPCYYNSLPRSSQKCVYEWNLLPDTFSHFQEHMIYHEGFVHGGRYCPSERDLTERYIWVKLKEIMTHVDLDSLTCKELRIRLEEEIGRNLHEYKSAIDKQVLVILGQMDSASKILDFLYLGSEWNASNFEEMDKVGIRYVLNISREIDNFFPSHFTYHNVRVNDNEQADLLRHWDETYRFISKAKETGTNTLVHCKMGISRSAATVVAFVMKEMGWSLDRAFKYVKERRKIIEPNPAFMAQLNEYQGILDASKQRHNLLWRSKSESSLSTCDCESLENISNPDIFSSTEDLNSALRRRSWSPDENTANALLGFPDPSSNNYAGEMYLRNPSPPSDGGNQGDEENESTCSEGDCSEIHIPVPTIQAATFKPPMSEAQDVGLDQAEGGAEEHLSEKMVVVEVETKELESIENNSQSDELSEREKRLNKNNNSATNKELLRKEGIETSGDTVGDEEEDVLTPVDVKERIITIENQIGRLDSTGSPEKKGPECSLLEELPLDTVRKQKEKLEQKMKGLPETSDDDLEQVFESHSVMEADEGAIMEPRDQGGEVDATPMGEGSAPLGEEDMDTLELPKDISTIKEELFQAKDHGPSEFLPAQYSSPSLSNLEPGSVQKSKEKFQSWQTKGWKSPTLGQDPLVRFESWKDSKQETMEGIIVEEEMVVLPESEIDAEEGSLEDKLSPDIREEEKEVSELQSKPPEDNIAENEEDKSLSQTIDPSQEVNKDMVIDGEIPQNEEGILSDVDPNTFILWATGEEIPLQPGTVRRQTQGFEQLYNMDGLEREAIDTGESSVDNEERGAEAAIDEDILERNEQKEHDEVECDLDTFSNSKEEGKESHKIVAMEQGAASLPSPDVVTDADEGTQGMKDSSDVETQSGWRAGDVKKHTQELEKLSASPEDDGSGQKRPSPSRSSETEDSNLTLDQLREIRDLGKVILCKDSSSDDQEEKDTEGDKQSSLTQTEQTQGLSTNEGAPVVK